MIALIILNFNSYNDTVNLVNDILDQNRNHWFTVIVVDNNSSNDIDKLQKYFLERKASFYLDKIDIQLTEFHKMSPLHFIRLSQNKGYSYGNNIGLRLAHNLGLKTGFVINPDIKIPDYTIFDDAISVFSNESKIGVIGYRVVLPNGKNQGPFLNGLGLDKAFFNLLFPLSSGYFKFFHQKVKKRKGYIEVPAVVGCFVGFDLNKLNNVGFYDENIFLYYEEYIISFRMKKRGYSTVYRDNFFVLHNHDYENEKFNPEAHKWAVQSKSYYEREYLKLSPFENRIIKITDHYYKALKLFLNYLSYLF